MVHQVQGNEIPPGVLGCLHSVIFKAFVMQLLGIILIHMHDSHGLIPIRTTKYATH